MNFEDISRKLKKISKDTVTEVQKMNEVRQLNSKINEEKKKMNSVYQEMGKKLYNLYKDAPLEGFEDEIHTIQEKYSMIDLLQDQIRAVKGVALCPCCNTEVGLMERFCSNCGSRMPEVFVIEDEDEIETVLEQDMAESLEDKEAEDTAEEVVIEAAEEEDIAQEVVEETSEECTQE